jgi:hypothetical protein
MDLTVSGLRSVFACSGLSSGVHDGRKSTREVSATMVGSAIENQQDVLPGKPSRQDVEEGHLNRQQRRFDARSWTWSRLRRHSPSTATFGYARVEPILGKVFDAEDAQRGAFRGRLKHFRKLGIPAKNPGKGSRLQYSAPDLFQLLAALELSEFNIEIVSFTSGGKRPAA